MMSSTKRVCIIGGGASGVSAAWALTRSSSGSIEVTLLHDDHELGGHSKTLQIEYRGKTYPIDVGVQFIAPLLYPNLMSMLALPDFARSVPMQVYNDLKISGAFKDGIWGSFPAYQKQPRFDLYTPKNVESARMFTQDILLNMLRPETRNMTIKQYLDDKGPTLGDSFIDFWLMPYLSIMNGYGTSGLEQVTMLDLMPLFTQFPQLITPYSPLGSFTEPGQGWQRFLSGSSTWINAMATAAKLRGAIINHDPDAHTAPQDGDTYPRSTVTAVYPVDGGVAVEWNQTNEGGGSTKERAVFDDVVLSTDMQTNRALLKHHNPYYAKQIQYINEDRFDLMLGSSFVHSDTSILAPNLQDQLESLQFTGYYADTAGDGHPWRLAGETHTLPYDMERTYSTFVMRNIIPDMPHDADVFVTMYGSQVDRKPARDKLLYPNEIRWLHGRWSASYFGPAKLQLHEIQGLGGMWFAGNNTTTDSEEGALISGLVIAGKLAPTFDYVEEMQPSLSAMVMYQLFANIMFPESGVRKTLAETLAEELAQKLEPLVFEPG